MKINFVYILSFLLLLNRLAFASIDINIIPEPYQIIKKTGVFKLNSSTVIKYNNDDIRDIVEAFQKDFEVVTGYSFAISTNCSRSNNSIIFEINQDIEDNGLGKEGYELNITQQSVYLKANTPHGIFNSIQSLKQLLPPEFESGTLIKKDEWTLPSIEIIDFPRFAWRGLMLDVSRHFFSTDFVKRYLDQMAKYKMNVFHWHLTDDNGWRIEIKGLPKLTEVGAWRAERKGKWASLPPEEGEALNYGGFYTQEEIKEIVKYAQDRFITIVPEIDVPGHSLAMIAAYPELSCSGEQYMINNGMGLGDEFNVLCASNNQVYEVLDTIFTQISKLFPGEFIHVGADEVNYSFWNQHENCNQLMDKLNITEGHELQNYFEQRVERIIQSKGKKMICWYGEYLEGLSPETAVYSWQGNTGGIISTQQNRNVVMTPDWETYLDFYQGDPSSEPFSIIGGIVRLKHCYNFDIVPNGANEKLIMGGQGNLWAESVPNERHAEYMTWPRALALSEIFWSQEEKHHWTNFLTKVERQLPRFSAANINFATSFKNAIITGVQNRETDELLVKLDSEYPDVDIFFNFDGTVADNFSTLYKKELLKIPKGATHIRVITYRDGQPWGKEINFPLSDLNNPLLR